MSDWFGCQERDRLYGEEIVAVIARQEWGPVCHLCAHYMDDFKTVEYEDE